MSPNPAYIVEGDLEQDFVQSICKGAPVRRIGCNGDRVEIAAIAKKAATHARMLQRKYDPIIIVFDRERRDETVESLKEQFITALRLEGVTATLIVGIPDRNIENWILADLPSLAESIGVEELTFKNYEGESGKNKLRQLLPEDKVYVETLHGVIWLKNSNPLTIRQNSASFAMFIQQLKSLECWWLKETRIL
jgi:hypothetical protein